MYVCMYTIFCLSNLEIHNFPNLFVAFKINYMLISLILIFLNIIIQYFIDIIFKTINIFKVFVTIFLKIYTKYYLKYL